MSHALNNQAGCGPGLAVFCSLEGKVFEVAGHPSVFASPGSHALGGKWEVQSDGRLRHASVCQSPDPFRLASPPPCTQHPRPVSLLAGPMKSWPLDPFTGLSTGESTPPVRPAAEGSNLTALPQLPVGGGRSACRGPV